MSAKLFSLAMGEIADRYVDEALAYQAPVRRRTGRLLRRALAACLALMVALGTAMVVSAELRQTVLGWITRQYETFTHYAYPEEAADTPFVPHGLTEVPPGYTEVSRICDEDIGMQMTVYRHEASGRQLLYTVSSSGSAFVEAEGCTVQAAEVDGAAATLYLPADVAGDGCIVWTRGGLFFYLSGSLTPEELVHYAACLQPEP